MFFLKANAEKHLHVRCFDLTPNRLKLTLSTANLVLVHPFTAVLLTPVSRFAVSATVIASVAVPILQQGQGTAVYTQLANGSG